MARVCEICGKGTQVGNAIETRGKAKYLGGVGTKVTGITRRQFKPNLQRVRITTAGGTNRSGTCVHAVPAERGRATRRAPEAVRPADGRKPNPRRQRQGKAKS